MNCITGVFYLYYLYFGNCSCVSHKALPLPVSFLQFPKKTKTKQ